MMGNPVLEKPLVQPPANRLDFDPWLALEDSHELWHPEALGVKLWPGIRMHVYNALVSRAMHYSAYEKTQPREFLSPRMWAKDARTLAYLFLGRSRPQHSALFLVGVLDSLYNYYYRYLDNPLVIDTTSSRGRLPGDNSQRGATVILENVMRVLAALQARTLRLDATVERTMTDMVERVVSAYAFPELRPRLSAILNSYVRDQLTIPPLFERRIIPRLRGKLAFISSACYMGRMALLVKPLREQGFTVVESQHGMIYREHAAYNYSPAVLNNPAHPAHAYLPDYFLTYGDYWGKQIRLPVREVVIGYPRLSEMVARLKVEANPQQILIASSGAVTANMVAIALKLSREFPDHQIIFKLHPGEIPFAQERCKPLEGLPNVQIIGQANIHELIARSAVIIGEATTVLFEAQAFPNKRVFIWRNVFTPEGLGQVFATPEALPALLRDPSTGWPQHDATSFWAADWENRITTFLKNASQTGSHTSG